MNVYQLVAKGSTILGYKTSFYSKDVFTTEEGANVGIAKFISNCCDESFPNSMCAEDIKVSVIKLTLIGDK